MDAASRESRALARWKPPAGSLSDRALAALVIGLSRTIMRGMNSLTIEGAERFDRQLERGGRGLLTFSNHVSLFDDPLLLSNLRLPPYRRLRWVASDALNFFGSPWKSFIFNAGKCVPVVRGRGFDQPGFAYLLARLREGAWVHIFPEGRRTRDPGAMLSGPFKAGIGRLIVESEPLLLPFYHHGMRELLPVGSRLPRLRKRVRMVFGREVDGRSIVEELRRRSGPDLSEAALWDAVAQRTYELLRRLEAELHPCASVREEVAA